ncbi:class I SAM-dependent methyltransferase [Couchioplanes caeruleus]|uniref:class I SAM-dependent methyltransferase n=1 Tax=Couchioplanes caeruleus TaxID=56438 RepID=UPI0020BE88E9|nr:class I SAM-dependent methyltransferase [Couchioplanes caeruleus]UQU61354.1 class I SAM-dependent methyltransferase [Couchioplanes caeruleus]
MEMAERTARSAKVAAVFDGVADVYDQVGVPWFTPIAQQLVRLAAPAPGERVLDVGCGRGAATVALAEAVGGDGHVTGIDLSARMVEACRADVARLGLANVDLQVMDASAPSLPGGYDLVVSSLVVFFLPDPPAALAAWRRLLVTPGGRLAISTFGSRDPVWDAVDATFRPYLPAGMLDARTTGAAGPFSSDAGVEELVRAAGCTGVRTVLSDIEVTLADGAEWYAFSRSHGQRAMWDAIPESDHDAVRAAAETQLDRARGADGRIHLHQQVRCTLATSA